MNNKNLELKKTKEKYQNAKKEFEFWTTEGMCEPESEKWKEVEAQYRSAKDDYDLKLKEIELEIDHDDKSYDNILIFFSYSHIDREHVGKIKKELEHFGFEVFVAHDDIEPSQEWKTVIENNLNRCTVFIPFITTNFSKSKWTEQECGIAYQQKKIVIPLFQSIKPYGFIEIFQGFNINSKSDYQLTKELVNIILKKMNFEKYKDYFINKFVTSQDFDDANYRTRILKKYNSFSIEQINLICRKSIKNSQIYNAFTAKNFLKALIEKYKTIIDPNYFMKLKDL